MGSEKKLVNLSACSTPYGIRGRGTKANLTPAAKLAMCSTPYGIRGRGTSLSIGSFIRELKCSTPYGIRGRGTVAAGNDAHSYLCSTPYGIRGRGTFLPRLGASQNLYVLNALRHQR